MTTTTSPAGMRQYLPSIAFNAVVPLVAYLVIRPYVGSDVIALLITGAIPLVVTLGKFLVNKRLDVIGVISLVSFVIAVVVQLLAGGNGLFLKLHMTVVMGPVGVLFLLSALVGRPLFLVIFKLVASRNPKLASRIPDKRRATVFTLIIGAMLTVHAIVQIALAVTLPTAAFLAVSNPVGYGIIFAGVAVLLWARRRMPRPVTV